MVPNPVLKTLDIWNVGQHNVALLGLRVDGMSPDFRPAVQWLIVTAQKASVPVGDLYDALESGLKANRESNATLELYLRNDDATEWGAKYRFVGSHSVHGVLIVTVQPVSCEKKTWPRVIVSGIGNNSPAANTAVR